MSGRSQAVFLSYASQDAAASREICEALRASGVEVWFDQNELVGGDAWDARIRQQIAACALFVPVISASTQARREGYFRLEWKLAAQRTHMIADGTPFLVPVVIDDTRDGDALVPAEFKAVQWTPLSDRAAGTGRDVPLEAFCSRVRQLLSGGPEAPRSRSSEPGPANSRADVPVRRGFRRELRPLAALLVLAAAALVLWLVWRGKGEADATVSARPQTPAATAPNGAVLGPKSLVVLPLENLSPEPENAFFAEGVHYEIISTLSRIPELKVVSRESAVALKNVAGSLAEKAAKVGVAHLISGSVRRDARTIRIHLELRRASDEAVLWQQVYDRPVSDGALALQSDIADQVARALQARNARGNYAGARYQTKDPRAYDLFLKTQHSHYQDRSTAAALRHIAELEKVLELDPGFSSAMRLLVTIHLGRRTDGKLDLATRTHHQQRAKHWIDTLVRVAPGGESDDAVANYLRVIERDYPRALAHAENSVRALPNDATAHNRLGLVLSGLGRAEDSMAAYREATRLDPLNPVFRGNLLALLSRLRRTTEFERAKTEAPMESVAWRSADLAYGRYRLTGELPAAIETLPADAQPEWFWRARRFEELHALVERMAGETQGPIQRWDLQLWKVDALRWLRREAEAESAASALITLAEAANAHGAFDLSVRDFRMAETMARLNRADEALAAARRYVEAASETLQPEGRRLRERVLAGIQARLNRPRECCELLAKLLRVPSGITVPMLKVDPVWDHVRGDPAFQALLADPKNSAPF